MFSLNGFRLRFASFHPVTAFPFAVPCQKMQHMPSVPLSCDGVKGPFQGSGTGSWHIRCPLTPTRVLYRPSQPGWHVSPIESVGVRGQQRSATDHWMKRLFRNWIVQIVQRSSLLFDESFRYDVLRPSNDSFSGLPIPGLPDSWCFPQLLQAGRSGRAGEMLLPLAVPQPAWWLIPLSKWVITPVINGISRVNPLITRVITHLLSGISHQVVWRQPTWTVKSHNINIRCASLFSTYIAIYKKCYFSTLRSDNTFECFHG